MGFQTLFKFVKCWRATGRYFVIYSAILACVIS